MTSPGRRRAVRIARILQSWPLLYAAAAIVGLLICGTAGIAGRRDWLRFGLVLTVPFLGLLVILAVVLSISAVLKLGLRIRTLVTRPWSGRSLWRGRQDGPR